MSEVNEVSEILGITGISGIRNILNCAQLANLIVRLLGLLKNCGINVISGRSKINRFSEICKINEIIVKVARFIHLVELARLMKSAEFAISSELVK